MKLAMDAMGGDYAPKSIVQGALDAVKEKKDITIVLVGDERQIAPLTEGHPQLEILHTDEKIEASDQPTKAVRQKKNASMVLAINEVKEGRADAVISAGNTGALMTAGLFGVGRIKGINRPALGPTLPTIDKKGFMLIDAGSNMDAKAEHLMQYAIMGSIYAEKVRGFHRPKVGLLNVGEESGKGNELSKRTFELLREAPINFIGNVESRDLLLGETDVVVADGFSGNLILKNTEGVGVSMTTILKNELTASWFAKLISLCLYPQLKKLKDRLDYSTYGGACLFGLAAPIVKVHGSANERAVLFAIRQAVRIVEGDVVRTIEETILKMREESVQSRLADE